MEPAYTMLGQAAATTAVLAVDQGDPVQNVLCATLSKRLLKDDQLIAPRQKACPSELSLNSEALSP